MKFYFLILYFLSLYESLPIENKFKYDWEPIDQILESAIQDEVFPGCVALIASKQGLLYQKAFGNFTYGIPPPQNENMNPPMTVNTRFDMASCTKVIATTSAIAQFYQRGELSLSAKIIDFLGPSYGANGKETITVLNCLLHNAGYPPDPNPNYYSPEFGCPETYHYHPQENFSCRKKIYESLLNQTLQNPVGSIYIYSDLSMITLMYVVGSLAKSLGYIHSSDLIKNCPQTEHPSIYQCYYEAYVRIYILEPLKMKQTGFLQLQSDWSSCAPCENDTYYLHRVIQGQVSDGNAYALGGIAGHAGIFSNVVDLYTLMNRLMFSSPTDDIFLNTTTVKFFTTEYNHTQSSRALGWNTNDPTVPDYGWDLLCGNMSSITWMHVGFTGTELCGDPQRELITILLTNRVYPTATNRKIENLRRKFNSAVVGIFDIANQAMIKE